MKIDNIDQITNEQLANWIKEKEWDKLEYKENLSIFKFEELSKYFAAFANTDGGILVLGINKQGQTIGCSLNDEDRNLVSQQAANCDPHVMNIQIKEREYDNKKITLIYIPKSRMIHQDVKKRFPIKSGSIIAYHNIVSLIQSLKARELLTGKVEFLEEPIPIIKSGKRDIPVDVEFCLIAIKGNNKDTILEGLRELEVLIYKVNILDQKDILNMIKELLDNKETDILNKSLKIIEDMVRFVGREKGDDSEDRKKLIELYNCKILDIVKKEDIEMRAGAIRVLIEMDDDNFIEPLTKFILENEDSRNKFPFGTMRISNRKKLKTALLRKLEKNKLDTDVKKRIRDIIEETRRDY